MRRGGRPDRTHESVGPTDLTHWSGRPVDPRGSEAPPPPRPTFVKPGPPPPTSLSKRRDYPPGSSTGTYTSRGVSDKQEGSPLSTLMEEGVVDCANMKGTPGPCGHGAGPASHPIFCARSPFHHPHRTTFPSGLTPVSRGPCPQI